MKKIEIKKKKTSLRTQSVSAEEIKRMRGVRIHPSAIVSSCATIGRNVSIGAFTIIHDHVVLGDNVVVESHCELGNETLLASGSPLIIGNDSLIRSHSCFYQGSEFGPGLRTGNNVLIREKVKAGDGLQIGSLCDFQGHCEIGDYVRTHSNVHIGQKSKIEDFVWIFPYVVLTNDPHPPSNHLVGVTLKEFSVVATMSVVLPGVIVGERSLVAAHSMVSRDVSPDSVVAGSPAKFICETSKIQLKDGSGSAYPWVRHFHRGYPSQITNSQRFKH